MEEKKKMSKKKKTVLIVGLCLLVLLLALLVTGFVFGKSLLGNVGRLDGEEETISQAEEDDILKETDPLDQNASGQEQEEQDGEEEDRQDAELVENSKKIVNILLVGQDRRSDQGKKRQRSDSMILCTINKEKKTLTITSFMRDLWVKIPDKYYERLNVPYAVGGFKLLNATLESEFGIKVDHNIEVDFAGFADVIDALGGVEVTLTSGEARYVSAAGEKVGSGTHLLNGEQALEYARIRKIGSDFGRTKRQRKIITTLFNNFKDAELSELYNLAKKILSMIRTDMTDSEILGYVMEYAPMLSEMELVSQRIPIDDAYVLTRIKGKSVIYLNNKNRQKNLDFLRETIGE